MTYWKAAGKPEGAGRFDLATGRADVIQAFMESIAYDHVINFKLLDEEVYR
jgi:hypothetical protein